MSGLARFLSVAFTVLGVAVIVVQDFAYPVKLALALLLGLALALSGWLATRYGWWSEHD